MPRRGHARRREPASPTSPPAGVRVPEPRDRPPLRRRRSPPAERRRPRCRHRRGPGGGDRSMLRREGGCSGCSPALRSHDPTLSGEGRADPRAASRPPGRRRRPARDRQAVRGDAPGAAGRSRRAAARRERPAPMIIDASAVIAILFDEPDAGRYAEAILATEQRRISAASLAEASSVVEAQTGRRDGVQLDALLPRAEITTEPVSVEQAWLARQALVDFGEAHHPARLDSGDCFADALAKATGEPLLFRATTPPAPTSSPRSEHPRRRLLRAARDRVGAAPSTSVPDRVAQQSLFLASSTLPRRAASCSAHAAPARRGGCATPVQTLARSTGHLQSRYAAEYNPGLLTREMVERRLGRLAHDDHGLLVSDRQGALRRRDRVDRRQRPLTVAGPGRRYRRSGEGPAHGMPTPRTNGSSADFSTPIVGPCSESSARWKRTAKARTCS